ncbi:hypothetical protein D5086_000298 [Populus alba]|uniref:Uncharacterized protein n=1 Tax=Populus alba TaxID=43335 RepID=A0ACC4CVH3_POPAL
MTVMPPPPPTVSPPSTTCASLLHELQGRGTLKQQISAVNTVLDELRLKKQERIKVFYEKQSQIAQICAEIVGNDRFKVWEEQWDLMNSPVEERKLDQVTILISSSVDDVSRKGCLAVDVIEQQIEPEEVYRGAHMDVDSDAARQILISLIESEVRLVVSFGRIFKAGVPCNVNSPEFHKTILFVMVASGFWSLDDNRYGAGRGAHKNLRRAEKELILASKTPSVVENLSSIVEAWEMERNIHFLCDKEREEEKRRSREKKRLQEQFAAEQDTLYGSRLVVKKPLDYIISSGFIDHLFDENDFHYAICHGVSYLAITKESLGFSLLFLIMRKDYGWGGTRSLIRDLGFSRIKLRNPPLENEIYAVTHFHRQLASKLHA